MTILGEKYMLENEKITELIKEEQILIKSVIAVVLLIIICLSILLFEVLSY